MDKSVPQVEYGQDIQEMARSADGPFSTRVPNSSDTALLYAQVPDPSRPIEFKTSLEPVSLAQAYELAHEPAKVHGSHSHDSNSERSGRAESGRGVLASDPAGEMEARAGGALRLGGWIRHEASPRRGP